VPAHFNELTPGHLRGVFPGLAYQCGVLCASSITYIEAVLGEHFTYAAAMGLLVAGVYLTAAIVFSLGPEKKGVSFAREQAAAAIS
jgi:SHS family lactate transporter-like MFS transporter